MEYTTLTKKAKKVITLTALIEAVAFAAAGIAAALNLPIYFRVRPWLCVGVVALALLWLAVYPAVRFKRYKYLITPDRIEIIEGVFWIKRTVVPIDRIHQISVARGPIDSFFGVAKVSVITAGSTATMRFLELEKANEIAMHLNGKIKQLGGEGNVR